MQDIYKVVAGKFGRVVVLEASHDLVPHAHEHIQLGYWLGGGGARSLVGNEETVLNESLFIACNSYQSHGMELNNPSEPVLLLLLHIDVAWLDGFNQTLEKPVVFSSAQLRSTPEIRELTELLMHKIMSFEKSDERCLEDDVMALMHHTVQQSTANPSNKVYLVRRRMPDYRLRLALAYMKENITHMSLMSHVAGVVGVSRSRLYELFFDEIQSSPKMIWNSMRLDLAMMRLSMGADSIAKVADDLGFSSPGNFSRFFKKQTRLSPFEFKKISNKRAAPLRLQHQRVTDHSKQSMQSL